MNFERTGYEMVPKEYMSPVPPVFHTVVTVKIVPTNVESNGYCQGFFCFCLRAGE